MSVPAISLEQSPAAGELLRLGGEPVPVQIVRNPRARRYLLRICRDGSLRLTIPRGGTRDEGLKFLHRQAEWVAKNRARLLERRAAVRPITAGSMIWFQGVQFLLSVHERDGIHTLQFADQQIHTRGVLEDWRPLIDSHLRKLAASRFPGKVHSLAGIHGLQVRRVTVRSQRSRWGSCSARKTISLNWRLIQAPEFVQEYVIVHELMHLREMNHSRRFWELVAGAFPEHRQAERWLKQYGRDLW